MKLNARQKRLLEAGSYVLIFCLFLTVLRLCLYETWILLPNGVFLYGLPAGLMQIGFLAVVVLLVVAGVLLYRNVAKALGGSGAWSLE